MSEKLYDFLCSVVGYSAVGLTSDALSAKESGKLPRMIAVHYKPQIFEKNGSLGRTILATHEKSAHPRLLFNNFIPRVQKVEDIEYRVTPNSKIPVLRVADKSIPLLQGLKIEPSHIILIPHAFYRWSSKEISDYFLSTIKSKSLDSLFDSDVVVQPIPSKDHMPRDLIYLTGPQIYVASKEMTNQNQGTKDTTMHRFTAAFTLPDTVADFINQLVVQHEQRHIHEEKITAAIRNITKS